MKITNYILTLLILLSPMEVSSQLGEVPETIMGLNSNSRIADKYNVIFEKNTLLQQAKAYAINNNISMQQAIEIVVNNISAELALAAQGSVLHTFTLALYGFELYGPSETAVATILADSRVQFIEVNQITSVSTTQTNPTWGLDRIDQQNLPLNNAYTYDQDGTGVNVYVLDSGVTTSVTEFGGRASAVFNTVGAEGNGDCTGHGTQVAGIIGSDTYGVAKKVEIKSVKIIGCDNQGDDSRTIRGINWVIANHTKPAVMNLSIEGEQSQSVTTAINEAIGNGITVVVSAGNDNVDACTVSPANVANAITVAASTILDKRSVFDGTKASNFGICVDLFAPGSDITSIDSTLSGTSFSAPHVTGAVALYLQENTQATPEQVKEVILNKATTVTIGNAGTGSPNKLLNMSNLVTVLDPPDIYEEDDSLSQISMFDSSIGGIQNRNFSDDNVDFIRNPVGNIGIATTFMYLKFTNLGENIDICVNTYKRNTGEFMERVCGINNTNSENLISICVDMRQGCFIADFEILNQTGLHHDTNYTLSYINLLSP